MDWGFASSAPSKPNNNGWDSDASEGSVESYEKSLTKKTLSTLNRVNDRLFEEAEIEFAKREEPAELDVGDRHGEVKNDGDDRDDPMRAMDKWYAEQDRGGKPDYEDWVKHFAFIRVIGKGIEVGVGGTGEEGKVGDEEKEEEEEVIMIHDGESLRDEVKRKLVESLIEGRKGRRK
mmetsp:Transcript_8389/g.16952  ORF Transcript_8389/g.16952 Transcript_8389/m.16952 type:complete len:176 (+) Transcript_8389:126-653(+)